MHIDAINEQHVEIDIQIEYAANILNQHDHTGLRSGFYSRLACQVCGSHAITRPGGVFRGNVGNWTRLQAEQIVNGFPLLEAPGILG